MTKLLVSDDNPDGAKLEDILRLVRNDILLRCSNMMSNGSDEAEHVITNNMQILPLLSEAILLAEDSSEILSRLYGEAHAAKGEPPS